MRSIANHSCRCKQHSADTNMQYEAKVAEVFSIELQDFQRDCLCALLKGRDVFLSIRTGGGKSICYQAFITAYNSSSTCSSTATTPCALIVSPLISIMKEQCQFLSGLGIPSAYIGSDEEEDILNGGIQYVFTSPESLLRGKWRDWATNNSSIKLIAIDEAHTVLHWGESLSGGEAFRKWYGRLGELRSLVQCPVILLTATANMAARTELQRKFCMVDCLEIIQNPDRHNIKLFLQCVKCSMPLDDIFYFLIVLLREKKELSDRFLIFCPTIRTCSKLFTMFRINFKNNMKLIDYIEMYHSKTPDDVKEYVRDDMSKVNGKIRVLIATSAAGMGVNFKGVANTINFGYPRDMDSFVQQYGRAGRDGGNAMSILIFTKRDIRSVDDDMKLYVQNESHCRRETILSAYKCKPLTDRNVHMCCDICAKKCQVKDCEECCVSQHPFYNTKLPAYDSTSSDDDDDDVYSDAEWD